MMKNKTRKFVTNFLTSIFAVWFLIHSPSAIGQTGCSKFYFNPQNSYPHNTASQAPFAFALKPGQPLGSVSYKVSGEPGTFTLEDYLGKFCTTGFLVLKDDQVVFERYLQGAKSSDSFFSASMSKTILALIVGIAVSEGKLALNERVDAVLPDFKDSVFANSTVEDVLRMASGAALKVSYEQGDVSDNRSTDPTVSPRQNIREYLSRMKDRAAPTGTVFEYNGAQSALLGTMLVQRTGGNLTSYLQDKIWIPMGAESKSYWIKNLLGEEGVQGQFAANLHDYARLGYLVMNQGRMNGKDIVPAEWIKKMTELRRDKPQPPNPPYYGLHTWIPQSAGGRSMFMGVGGQNIFIDPIARVVIVHTGNSQKAEFNGGKHLFALRDAIFRSLLSTN